MGETAHESDLYAWCTSQASLLRSNGWTQIDRENLAEEIQGLARRELRELTNRLTHLVMHLLKYRLQAELRNGRCRGSIREQRFCIGRVIKDNPSLKPTSPDVVELECATARKAARHEPRRSVIPEVRPFTLDQIPDPDFLPD